MYFFSHTLSLNHVDTCSAMVYLVFAVHGVINDGFGSILPAELQRSILDGIFTLGRAQLSDFVLNENNPLGSSRLAKVRRIFEEGRSLQLQFPAEDLGFRYCQNVVYLIYNPEFSGVNQFSTSLILDVWLGPCFFHTMDDMGALKIMS